MDSMHRTRSHNVLLYLSATPFDEGLYGAVSSLLIPCKSQKDLNSADVNSPPLSVLRHFSFVPFWVVTNA